jgi:hypothetical protein
MHGRTCYSSQTAHRMLTIVKLPGWQGVAWQHDENRMRLQTTDFPSSAVFSPYPTPAHLQAERVLWRWHHVPAHRLPACVVEVALHRRHQQRLGATSISCCSGRSAIACCSTWCYTAAASKQTCWLLEVLVCASASGLPCPTPPWHHSNQRPSCFSTPPAPASFPCIPPLAPHLCP